MATLPTKPQLTGTDVTKGGFKAALEQWRDMIAGVIGTLGTPADARTTLQVQPTASPAFTGTPLAPTATSQDDSTQIATTAFINNMAGRITRQTALFGKTDANGYASFLTVGAGLRPGLLATATVLALSYSNGMVEKGEAVSADVADILGVDLPINNTIYLYKTRGTATWGSTLIPPDYGYAFDRTQGALLNFEGTNGAVATTDDFGNTWAFSGNAALTTAQFKFGASSLLLDGTGDFITSTNITSLGYGSWEVSGWGRTTNNAIAVQTFFNAYNAATFGIHVFVNATGKVVLSASSNGTSYDIVNASAGATTLAINTWYKIRVVFDALAGTYRVYLSNNGAAETQEITVSSSARLCAFTNFRIGSDSTGTTNSWNGQIDAFRFIRAATKPTTETPSASAPTITDYKIHFFSIPDMAMYEVTAASVTAGVNPTLTQTYRLFLGECDTSGAAVTAVRTYALRGQYVSAPQAVVTDTRYVLAANLGVVQLTTRLKLRNGNNSTTGTGIYEGLSYAAGASFFMANPVIIGIRGITLTLNSGDSGIIYMAQDGSAQSIQGVAGSTCWVEAERTW